MFCPKCRSEYREGFVTCADCGATLVSELPPEDEPPKTEYVSVYSTTLPVEIAVLESALRSEGLDFYFDIANNPRALSFSSSVLWVRRDQAARAREIVEEDLSTRQEVLDEG